MTQETRACQNCKSEFVIEPEDFDFYKKVNVPPPTFCPDCRFQRRAVWRNEWRLFKKKSALDGTEIFSNWPPQSYIKIYPKEYWWSDAWDPMQYGREYDFSRPFLTQFRELLGEVPFPSRALIGDIVNSDYTMNAGWLKNCYLVFNIDFAEDSAYLNGGVRPKHSFDCHLISNSELCYGSLNISRCYGAILSTDCEDCVDTVLCRDCVGCTNCFGCVNLKNKSYHIFNQPYTREAYFEELVRMNIGSSVALETLTARAYAYWNQFPVRYLKGWRNANVSGEYISYSKNVHHGYRVNEGENLRYCQMVLFGPVKDSMDQLAWGKNAELVYEAGQCGAGSHNVKFCYGTYSEVKDTSYCVYCHTSSNLFGCSGLRNKQYCILNKQYTRGEYEALVPKIIEHMNAMPYTDAKGRVYRYGEFFPFEFSPLAYNETIAQEYFPLTAETAAAQGVMWRESEQRHYTITLPADRIPDTISEAGDDILNQTIECRHRGECADTCSGAFRIILLELQYYRSKNIPLPRLCPNCRHWTRIKQRNSWRLYQRQCQCAGTASSEGIYKNMGVHQHGEGKCPNQFETSYAPERSEIVYCEQCYNAEVA